MSSVNSTSRPVSQKEPTALRSLTRAPENCRAFTLIEVLVTVVILAVGLLGLAGMQAASMRNNHSAYLRSQAVQLSYDMADRVRSRVRFRSISAAPANTTSMNRPAALVVSMAFPPKSMMCKATPAFSHFSTVARQSAAFRKPRSSLSITTAPALRLWSAESNR